MSAEAMSSPASARRTGIFAPLFERPALIGLVGVLLAFFALGGMQLLAIPHAKALDEPRHIAYAIELAEGRLPDVRSQVDLKKLHTKRIRGTKMHAAAAHPPLYYVIVGFPLKWASEGESIVSGLWVSRLLTLLMGAAGLIYAYLAAVLLVPRRREAALSAVALCAVTPAFVNVCSVVHNDALAFLTTAGLCHAVLLVLLRGPAFSAVLQVVIWGALACASRFASLLVVAPALTAVGLALLLERGRPPLLRLRNVAAFSGAALGLIAITSGWFYLHNYRMYDDVTAGKPLFVGLSRPVREAFYYHLLKLDRWELLVTDLWCRLAGGVLLGGAVALAGTLLVVAGLLAATKALATDFRPQPGTLLKDKRTFAVVFVVVAFLVMVVPIFEFYARGGNMTARYYFPVLWVLTLAVSAGYGSFKNDLVGKAVLLGACLLGLWITDLYIAEIVGNKATFAIAFAFAKAELPLPDVLACSLIACAVLGFSLLISGWQGLRARQKLESGT